MNGATKPALFRNGDVGKIDDVPTLPISRRQAIVVALALAVLLLLASRWVRAGSSAKPAAAPVPIRAGVPTRPKIVVDVTGAVRRPGLYRLADGSRVADAVERAGGVTRRANLEAVNLAAPLADGQQVLVPRKIAASDGAAAPGGETAAVGPVSLSAATLEQLDSLPGVGPITAQKILDYRTAHGAFRSVEELDAVPGIGPARIEQLRDLVVP